MAVAVAVALAGCAQLPLLASAAPPSRLDRSAAAAELRRPGRTVVLVSVDGLAPWVLADTETPTLDALAAEGTVAVHAETVVPSLTLPSHTSMISGVGPERHGVDWNRWEAERRVDVPTVFTSCRAAGLRCGLVAGKPKFAHFAVFEPGVEHYAYVSGAEAVLDEALDWLDEREPHFLMIHLAEVDQSGHRSGWGSEAQRDEIRRIDTLLGKFLDEARDELEGRLTLIVTADHGGQGRRHGSDAAHDVGIPWIAWGDGVPAGGRIPRVATVDTAATVLSLLDLPVPGDWLGISRFPFYRGAGAEEGKR